MDRRKIAAHTGNISQLCGVERHVIAEGKGEGIKTFEVYNDAGLSFNVLESRCMDLYRLRYKGVNLSFISKPGLVNKANADLHGMNFLRSAGAGLLYTCGLSNVGAAYSDASGDHIFHGRARFLPAEESSASCAWQGEDYVMRIEGRVRESGLFRENLTLTRTIETCAGSKRLTWTDTIENEGFETQDLMLMYHINLGYPLIEEG